MSPEDSIVSLKPKLPASGFWEPFPGCLKHLFFVHLERRQGHPRGEEILSCEGQRSDMGKVHSMEPHFFGEGAVQNDVIHRFFMVFTKRASGGSFHASFLEIITCEDTFVG